MMSSCWIHTCDKSLQRYICLKRKRTWDRVVSLYWTVIPVSWQNIDQLTHTYSTGFKISVTVIVSWTKVVTSPILYNELWRFDTDNLTFHTFCSVTKCQMTAIKQWTMYCECDPKWTYTMGGTVCCNYILHMRYFTSELKT